jgi:hypothetical protein
MFDPSRYYPLPSLNTYFFCCFPVNGHIHISYLPSSFDIVPCLLQVSGGSKAGCVLVVELGELKYITFNALREIVTTFTQTFNTMPYTVPRLAPTEISAGISRSTFPL